jgi:hypothetical protein
VPRLAAPNSSAAPTPIPKAASTMATFAIKGAAL